MVNDTHNFQQFKDDLDRSLGSLNKTIDSLRQVAAQGKEKKIKDGVATLTPLGVIIIKPKDRKSAHKIFDGLK